MDNGKTTLFSSGVFNFFEKFFHFEDMIESVVAEEFQDGDAAELVANAGGEFFFDLMVAFFDLAEGRFRILHLEKAEVEPGFQQVGSHFDAGNGYHSAADHGQTEPLKNEVHLFIEESCDLFLPFSFFHTLKFTVHRLPRVRDFGGRCKSSYFADSLVQPVH